MSQVFRCNQCEYWESLPDIGHGAGTSGTCRGVLPTMFDEDGRGRWPIVYLDDWCAPGLLNHQKKLVAEEAALAQLVRGEG